jgi:hypothetical protein
MNKEKETKPKKSREEKIKEGEELLQSLLRKRENLDDQIRNLETRILNLKKSK